MVDVRRAAVNALIKQEKNGYSNLVLNAVLADFDGSPRERSFLSFVFYGTIERQITLDFILQKFISKPLNKLDAPVRAILRSGLFQARFMDSVPVSAAINEAVTLTRKMGKTSAAGMVNAVLRKATAYDLTSENWQNEIQRLSVEYSVSNEIAKLLYEKLPNNYEQILKASFGGKNLCIRVNTLQTTVKEIKQTFEKQGINTYEGSVENCLYVDYRGDITSSKMFKRGYFHVQGEASQFACAALSPKKGNKVVDLCAAPGGKSITIAQLMENSGQLISCDVAQNRLSLIESAFARMNINCAKIVHNDASVYNADFENSHCVLCDVPCSGIGIMAKKPDIRHKDLNGLNQLTALQLKILQTSSRYIKKGGTIVYSTCTINPDENENVVKEFLSQNSEFVCEKQSNLPKAACDDNGFVTFYPSEENSDGFFVAVLKRLN